MITLTVKYCIVLFSTHSLTYHMTQLRSEIGLLLIFGIANPEGWTEAVFKYNLNCACMRVCMHRSKFQGSLILCHGRGLTIWSNNMSWVMINATLHLAVLTLLVVCVFVCACVCVCVWVCVRGSQYIQNCNTPRPVLLSHKFLSLHNSCIIILLRCRRRIRKHAPHNTHQVYWAVISLAL